MYVSIMLMNLYDTLVCIVSYQKKNLYALDDTCIYVLKLGFDLSLKVVLLVFKQNYWTSYHGLIKQCYL